MSAATIQRDGTPRAFILLARFSRPSSLEGGRRAWGGLSLLLFAQWSLKGIFPEAPSEVTFPVKAKDFTRAKVVFEFVSLFVG